MPELPEVETMRRGLREVVGSRIGEVKFIRSRLKPIAVHPSRAAFRRRVLGRQFQPIERLGKRIVLPLCDGQSIVIEPRMTGLVLLSDPPDREHLRLGLRLEGGSARWLWFWDRRGLGTLAVLDGEELAERFGPHKLGPDALAVTAAELRQRLSPCRREIKVALLDQRLLAGIGNLYASEILHVAGVHPQRHCQRLTCAEWQRLHAAIREVLLEAIQYEGSTLSDGTYRNALNRSGRYQNHHRVYARRGQLCLRCQQGTCSASFRLKGPPSSVLGASGNGERQDQASADPD